MLRNDKLRRASISKHLTGPPSCSTGGSAARAPDPRSGPASSSPPPGHSASTGPHMLGSDGQFSIAVSVSGHTFVTKPII